MNFGNPLEVNPTDVKEKLDRKETFILLDCREQEEYEHVHIGSAQWLPMSELEHRVGELEPLQTQEIIVYCHHGQRSLMVTNWLLSRGFSNVKSMAGGIDLWAEQIDPQMPRY